MADPLSVAASIAGIVSLGIQVSSGLFQFCQSVRDAPEDLETIHSDLLALCKILEEVQELSKPGKGKLQAGTTAHAVRECARIFNILQTELEKSSKQLKVKQGRAGKFILSKVERVGYFYRKSGLEKLRQDILHAKMTLMLAITVAEAYGRSKSEKGMDAREKFQLYATILSLQEKVKGQEKKNRVHQGGNQPTGDKGLDHIDSDSSVFGQFSSGSFFALTPSIPPVTPPSPMPNVPKPFQDGGKPDDQPTPGHLQAWISKFHVNSSNTALNCVVEPINLPPEELFSWVKNKHRRDHDDSQEKQQQASIGEDTLQPPPVLDVLAGLGNGPRSMILSHITSFGGSASLLAVQPCSPFSMPTPFGDMELQPFMWVTLGGATAASDDRSKVERARRAEEEAKKKIEQQLSRREKVEREGTMVKKHGEAEEAKRMAEEQKKAEERRKAEEERMEAELRGRLSKFGFQENQVMAMVKPGKAQHSPVAGISPPDTHQRPTYVKVHRDHLSTETLAYYDLPWEFDRQDSDYIIILRELDRRETDVLFEHTKRIRRSRREEKEPRLLTTDYRDRREHENSRDRRRRKSKSPRITVGSVSRQSHQWAEMEQREEKERIEDERKGGETVDEFQIDGREADEMLKELFAEWIDESPAVEEFR